MCKCGEFNIIYIIDNFGVRAASTDWIAINQQYQGA